MSALANTNLANIKITADKQFLQSVGGEKYAEAHAGKKYTATIDSTGWAITSSTKFPPDAFVKL